MIVAPCDADWNAMAGNDKIRFCESCQKNVHNLSRMDDREIRKRMGEAAGHFCARVEPVPTTSLIAQSVLYNMARVSALAAASVAIALPQQPAMPVTELAQRGLGRYEGTVVDPSGESVSNASVQLQSTVTPTVEYTVKSNSMGVILVDGIKPGDYIFTVHSPGFRIHRTTLQLASGDIAASTVMLQIGEITMGGAILVDAPKSSKLPWKLKQSKK